MARNRIHTLHFHHMLRKLQGMSTKRLRRSEAARRCIARFPAATTFGYSGEAAGLAADTVLTTDRNA
jgi:hypothetical protein